ncbi:chitinase 1 [Phtheirospermum japonicum]|uniref:Chitinase 1 n=1 Tax=Phtheirospermum japonicum TaxID=374723 RepID=A0A830CKN8_9LAMI|nr:chitinase 1 [Phtheirospermum japonicum]
MELIISKRYFMIIFQIITLVILARSASNNNTNNNNSNLFREYIGAEFKNVKFSDLPINPGVQFHFILSFAIDYTAQSPPTPTNGNFSIFWDSDNLGPAQVAAIKKAHPNVKVALSLGGDTVANRFVYFAPLTVDSWLSNAVSSLTAIIKRYNLDGIDVDYEHFKTDDTETFAECIGKLIKTLKDKRVISFASIAPYDDGHVQMRYRALWRAYGGVIDYVNFQFYGYDAGTSVAEFMDYFAEQSSNYYGGKVLASFISDGSGGLAPRKGLYRACKRLKREGNLHGIFVWCADDSKKLGFKYEKKYQRLLATTKSH